MSILDTLYKNSNDNTNDVMLRDSNVASIRRHSSCFVFFTPFLVDTFLLWGHGNHCFDSPVTFLSCSLKARVEYSEFLVAADYLYYMHTSTEVERQNYKASQTTRLLEPV